MTIDNEQVNEEIIHTSAPIPFEELKKFFQNDGVRYIVNISTSELKGDKLLTYLGNLDIPIDITYDKEEELFELAKNYLHFDLMVSINTLEDLTLGALFCLKGLDNNGLEQFVEDNYEILQKWERRLDQLLVYNFHTVNHTGYDDWIAELPVDEDDSREGINFVSLMKHKACYVLLQGAKEENKMFNPTFFNEPVFKGNNLFVYWAHDQNPIFLLQNAISSGEISGAEYARITQAQDDQAI